MSPPDVEGLVRSLLSGDVAVLDRDGCHRRLDALKRVRSWLGAEEIRTSRRMRELSEQGRAENPESAIRKRGGRSDRGARDVTDREETADALPGFESALAAGEVATEHLDALAAARKLLAHDAELLAQFAEREDELLEFAAREAVETFRRRCGQLAKRLIAEADAAAPEKELERQRKSSRVRQWQDKATGMHHFHIEVDPVRGSMIDRHLYAERMRLRAEAQADGTDPVPHAQLEVDAFVAAISTSGGNGPGLPEIVVHIGFEKLVSDVTAAGGLCETEDGVELPVATVRRLACDANILPAVMDSEGLVRDMGRGARTVTAAQRKQLATMHSTCGGRDCRVPFHKCKIHHVKFWTRDSGPTDLDNLIPLCEVHHHLVHEGGWTLTMTPDRIATWIMPDGTVYHQGPCTDRQPEAA